MRAPGVSWTRAFSDCPSHVAVCGSLRSVMETAAGLYTYLVSARAERGVLVRAAWHGEDVPDALRKELET